MAGRPDARVSDAAASGGATVPRGDNSVMPQLVCTRAPNRCSIRWISASGQLEPPMITRSS